MSICTSYPLANQLNYCGSKDYGPGIINIGTLEEDREPGSLSVLLTNLATGFVHLCSLYGEDLATVSIEMPSGLSPATMYEIKVVGKNDLEGIAPVDFFPFDWDGTDWTVAYDTVGGVNVKFIKIHANDGIHSHEEQFITLV